jgi:kinesin family protein 18/19
MKLLIKGNEQRSKASTAANASSSRSHAILQVHVRQTPNSYSDEKIKLATLSIIDLAGSERASATLNQGERLHEGANINRSLLALGNCINVLCSEKPNTHIPFRDSKLKGYERRTKEKPQKELVRIPFLFNIEHK